MIMPTTAKELLNWPISRGYDSYGAYTIITGYEGSGGCFWCGKELVGRRRFCKKGSGCWTRYQEHFTWGYAKAECLKRYEYRCANCGVEGGGLYIGDDMTNLRAHHIIPLNGAERAVNVYNIFWNLICFCHDCHLEVHAVMRPDKLPKPVGPDYWDNAIKRGQIPLELVV